MKHFLFISIPLFILDQATKGWVLQRFPDPREALSPPIEVIPNFFNLVRVHNTGMAFGLLNGHPAANWIFGFIGLVALTIIGYLWKKNTFPDKLSKIAAALLIAGILGNITDRVIPGRGYVVDFLDFKLPLWDKIMPSSGGHFPSFNVADSCICVAAVFLIIIAFRKPAEPTKA
ncbi:MAG: signal peptidase II [Verrucomicrobiota bacterium]